MWVLPEGLIGALCLYSDGGASGAASASAPSAPVLKKGVPLLHFHLIDLGMQVSPDNGGDLDFLIPLSSTLLPILRYHPLV